MNSQTTKKVTLALGVATVASQFGSLAVKAGPALQTLNNLTNTSEFTINNTFGGSFSVQGAITATGGFIAPFTSQTQASSGEDFNSGGATLTTGFVGSIGNISASAGLGPGLQAVETVTAFIRGLSSLGGNLAKLNVNSAAGIANAIDTIRLIAQTGTQTIGASISTTLFGPSNIKASSSFTSQIINDLSAF